MTTIAVIGNCQVMGIADCVRALAPSAEVWYYRWDGATGALDIVADAATCADLVITQIGKIESLGPLRTQLLRSRVRNMVVAPRIYFDGFHPDAVPLTRATGAPRSPLGGSFHSTLIVAAFLQGLSQARAADLFNAYFYARLGYFETFDHARNFFMREAKASEIDVSDVFEDWARDAFVYVPNHPSIRVLWEIAIRALASAHITTDPHAAPPPDRLAEAYTWPVYPELARRLNISGGLTFKRGAEAFSLPAMIARSYKAYTQCDPAVLAAKRIVEAQNVLRAEGL